MSLKSINVEIDYTGRGGDILNDFVLPLLSESIEYDRVTSFFTSESLIAISAGLEGLWSKQGRMRLVLGIHDVPAELAQAAIVADDPTFHIINEVSKRIIQGIATISDEISIDRLSTIAWMMNAGLLSIKVAAPEKYGNGSPGLFHNKLFIFKDKDKNVVAAVGSPNETSAGLGQNYEHLTAFTSWEQERYTQTQASFFESLWSNDQQGLQVRALDSKFANQILQTIANNKNINNPDISQPNKLRTVLESAAKMPALRMVSGGHAALYPHQELVFLNGLSRWPVRVLLGDEVGLGKTFEAGAIISYMISHCNVKRTVVMVPKAVVYQWQAELYEHFNIDAWIYESGRKVFVSSTGDEVSQEINGPILSPNTPDVVIISAQLARGTAKASHIFKSESIMPDLLIVDEAHAARVKPDFNDAEKPTLMWKMLNEISTKIPHLILATATPMQVHWREYHALMELLGLPDEWSKPDNYERSLYLTTQTDQVELADAGLAARLIVSALQGYRPLALKLSEVEMALVKFLNENDPRSPQAAIRVKSEWSASRSLLIKTHPAQFLTIRNTRTALEAINYKFPSRNLPPFSLSIPEQVKIFYQQVENYLSEAYFNVERALYPDRKFSIGFVKCAYQQRLASSLFACKLSFERRLNRVSEFEKDNLETFDIDCDIEAIDELVDSDIFDNESIYESQSGQSSIVNNEMVSRAARIERVFLNDLITLLNSILEDYGDPKMQGTVQLIAEHLSRNDQILVFSRYTDTLSSVVNEFHKAYSNECPPYAIYTGPETTINLGLGLVRSTRKEIRTALDSGDIRIVFCSDAASEGLNLQAARVIINVDVPWNPARLEQRIGRIARLGQKANSVDIYNLWYPESIEARMYTRLMERADLYELAVGEFPDVVGLAIRNQIASKYGVSTQDYDIITELNLLKNNTQISALRTLWNRNVSGKTYTERFREELATLATEAAKLSGAKIQNMGEVTRIAHKGFFTEFSKVPGRNDVISLNHPALKWLGDIEFKLAANYSIFPNGISPLYFTKNDLPIDPMTVPKYFEIISNISIVSELTPLNILVPDESHIVSSRWLPNARNLSIPVKLTCNLPCIPNANMPIILADNNLRDDLNAS